MGNFDYLVEGIEEVERHGQLFQDIRGVVNEELGIHGDVIKISFDIIREIEKQIKVIPKQYFPYIPGVSYRRGDFKYTAFGKTIDIEFRYCNFRDKRYYKKYVNKIENFTNGFKLSTLTLRIDIHAISGQIIENTFSDTVQHELEHFFQEDKIGKSFSEDNEMYKVARFSKDYYGNVLGDETAKNIGNIMYFTRKCEIEGYVNGLYALLVKNYKETGYNTSTILETSPIYQGLLELRRNKEWLLKNQNDINVKNFIESIRKKGLNITFEKIIKFADYADREIVKRIGRTIVKAQKDCNQFNDLEPTWWK